VTFFTPIGAADVIYLSKTIFFDQANSDPFDPTDISGRSAASGAGDATFSFYTLTEKIQSFNHITQNL
jgi:hypothetical protein